MQKRLAGKRSILFSLPFLALLAAFAASDALAQSTAPAFDFRKALQDLKEGASTAGQNIRQGIRDMRGNGGENRQPAPVEDRSSQAQQPAPAQPAAATSPEPAPAAATQQRQKESKSFLGNLLDNIRDSAAQAQQRSQTSVDRCATCSSDGGLPPQIQQAPAEKSRQWGDVKEKFSRDGFITIFGEAQDKKHVWAQITKLTNQGAVTNQTSNVFLRSDADGKFSQRLPLRMGSGAYQVKFYFNANGDTTYEGSFDQPKRVDNIDTRPHAKYLLPSEEVQSEHPEIVKLAMEIACAGSGPQECASIPDKEKSERIFRWVTMNIAYDTEALYSKIYSDPKLYKTHALSTLERKMAICQGYSTLNAALHRAVGIPAKVVTGITITTDDYREDMNFENKRSNVSMWEEAIAKKTTGEHAWNEIYLQGEWKVQDTTWSAGGVSSRTKRFTFKPTTQYLFPSPEKFAEDHRKLEDSND